MTASPAFGGFSRDLPSFLAELRDNNAKTWFDANRARYESVWLEPAKDFVSALAPGLHDLSPDLACEPKVNGAIMRINRDTRFSKDKTPYKTTADLHFLEGKTKLKSNPAYLFRITPEDFWIGCGVYAFSKPQLSAWREAVTGEETGPRLRDALDRAAGDGFARPGGKAYKTVPRGLPADHPNAELLQFNGIHVTRNDPHPDALFGPGAVDHCLGIYKTLRPVQAWFAETLSDKA